MDIAEKVKEIVSDKLDVDPADIQEDKDFVEDLKADSLAIVEVVLALEEQFEIEIPDEFPLALAGGRMDVLRDLIEGDFLSVRDQLVDLLRDPQARLRHPGAGHLDHDAGSAGPDPPTRPPSPPVATRV